MNKTIENKAVKMSEVAGLGLYDDNGYMTGEVKFSNVYYSKPKATGGRDFVQFLTVKTSYGYQGIVHYGNTNSTRGVLVGRSHRVNIETPVSDLKAMLLSEDNKFIIRY